MEFNVSLYQTTPEGEENLYRQTLMMRDRLKLYQIFKTCENITLENLKVQLENNPLVHLLSIEDTPEVSYARHVDVISHWTLKVRYCNTYPEFFIKNEVRWFKLRFDNMPHNQRLEFIKKNSNFTEANPEEMKMFDLKETRWFKFDFTEVTELVKLRLYPMWKGYIFIPEHKLVFWFAQKLEKYLRLEIQHCKNMLPSVPDQLETVFNSVDLVKPCDYISSRQLNLTDIEENVKHFPLCMKIQYENLQKNHHLKYPSRVQYGLFLKGLGLSLKDALTMWKEEFTKKMTEKRFNQEYVYFFKHQYGTVGSRINYQPMSCDKILESVVGSGEVHGCPFKHWDVEKLAERLNEDEVSDDSIKIVLDLKREEKYKGACTAYFNCSHRCKLETIIQHPNEYFEKSCESPGIEELSDYFEESCDMLDIEDLL